MKAILTPSVLPERFVTFRISYLFPGDILQKGGRQASFFFRQFSYLALIFHLGAFKRESWQAEHNVRS